MDTIYEYPNDNYYKFIIDNYREGNIEYLKKLGELSNHSGYRTGEVIYEIDLNSGSKKREVFKDILFLNGKPILEVE